MRRQIAARLGQSLIVVFLVTTISFFVIRLAPGDPFSYEDSRVSTAVRDQWRAYYGFDRPLPEQYVRYLSSIAHGRLGFSTGLRRPVTEVIADALPRTLLLAGLSLVLAFTIGVFIGVMQAARRGSLFDRVSSTVLLVFYSLPDFWGAMMILLMFAYWWRVFPAGLMVDSMHDYMTPWAAFVDRVKHLVLPVGALTVLTTASIARYQRTAMLEVLPSDFIRTARAKGLSNGVVLYKHALRNGVLPVVTMLGLQFGNVLAGAILTGRYQRIRETVLLRTLGATQRQLRQIQIVEYAVLGVLAAATGGLLAVAANALLARYVFKAPIILSPTVLLASVGGAVVVTLATGLLTNRGITRHPPLEVLRQET